MSRGLFFVATAYRIRKGSCSTDIGEHVMPISPVAKMVLICDDVQLNPTNNKISVLNLLDAARVPEGQSFPCRLNRFTVFVWWRGGHGRSKLRIDVSSARSGDLVRRFEVPVEFRSRTGTTYGIYRMDGCVFPDPDYYYVEVYCNDVFVDDQRLQLIGP
jgi:hypothetical protein